MTPAELAEILARLEAKADWLVAACKHLLAVEAGYDPADPDETDEIADWLAEVPTNGHAESEDWIAPRFAPKEPAPKACPHNQQVLVGSDIKCARCGTLLVTGGLVRSSVTPSGQIAPDPNPPKWATDHSPGASSKNPGTPLVPHTS